MIDVQTMTQAEREALPWYGGNKIPDSYLKRFCTAVEDEGIPYELQLFVDQLGPRSIEPPKQGAYMSSHD